MLYIYSKDTKWYTIPNLEMQMTQIKMNLFHSQLFFNKKGPQIKIHSIHASTLHYLRYVYMDLSIGPNYLGFSS